MVILEAMSCGVPTVGFATGGIPELIRQGETGFLVPALDMKALIAALRHALEPGVAASWGIAARQHVEKEFSSHEFLENHLRLYAEVVRLH